MEWWVPSRGGAAGVEWAIGFDSKTWHMSDLSSMVSFRSVYTLGSVRAVSSVGRAPRLHRGCRGFESPTAHQVQLLPNPFLLGRNLISAVAGRLCNPGPRSL